MRRFFLPILSLILFSTPAAALTETESPEEFQNREAIAMIQTGDNDGALVKIDTVIASFEHPGNDSKKAYFCADGLKQTLMVLATAAANNQAAEIADGSWCNAYFLKGFVLINLKRSAEAGEALQRAATMAPLNMHYLNELAEWYKSTGQWQQAIDTFKLAISKAEFAPQEQLSAMHARSLRGVGFGLIEIGKLDESENAFRESLKLVPDHPAALAELKYIEELRAKTTR